MRFVVRLVGTRVAHIHCKPFKKSTQFVSEDSCVLFHYAGEGVREQDHSRHSKNAVQMYWGQTKCVHNKTYRQDHTPSRWSRLDHSVMHHVHVKVVWFNNFVGLDDSFHVQLRPHRQRWQIYFRMIFFLGVIQLPAIRRWRRWDNVWLGSWACVLVKTMQKLFKWGNSVQNVLVEVMFILLLKC